MIFFTGGAGFIGSNFVLDWLAREEEAIVNIDKLTYAANTGNLDALRDDPRHLLVEADIGDTPLMSALLRRHRPRAVLHFAAESHVDRSIHGPAAFIDTNINGTFSLLDACRHYWAWLGDGQRAAFRFLHVSTDEVYGSLGPYDPPFRETTAYAPNSPYSASKAASDHLVRAWHHTYGLPTLVTHCSNNYGPYQDPEKLIPLMIANALTGKPLPVYGDGSNVRDWLYVNDHCAALRAVLARGRPGDAYNIGGGNEMRNRDVVHLLCDILDRIVPDPDGLSHRRLIAYVKDRPGHDQRYAVDAGKLRHELGWAPEETFDTGILKTVRWYLDHRDWVREAEQGSGREWTRRNDGRRGQPMEVA